MSDPEESMQHEVPVSNKETETQETEAAQLKLAAENSDLKDRLARLAADFDNYRKRMSQEAAQAKAQGVREAAQALMPVYDDLERAVQVGTEDGSKLLPGIRTVQDKVLSIFAKLGLEPTGQVGKHFDPQWHEAIQVVPGPTDDQIVHVHQLGFKMEGQLARPAQVVVSKKS